MEPQRRQRLVELVRIGVSKLVPPGSIPGEEAEFVQAGPNPAALPVADAGAYHDVVELLQTTRGWAERIADSVTETQVRELLAKAYHSGDALEATVDSWLEKMNGLCTTQTVYVALQGLRLEMQSLKVGMVRILQFSPDALAGLLVSHRERIMEPDALPERKARVASSLDEALSGLGGRPVAVMEVEAEPTRAKERAVEETKLAMEVLSFCLRPSPQAYERFPQVEGEASSSYGRVIAIRTDGRGFTRMTDAAGPLIDLVIDAEALAVMNSAGFAALDGIASKDDSALNDCEQALLRGAHWFVASLYQSSNDERLLRLITAMESSLTPSGGDPIGTAIAEGVALLLAYQFPERKQIKTRVKELYRKRSAVSHGGKKAVSDQDVGWLEELVFALLHRLLSRKDDFSTREQLLAHIEELKLGGSSA